MAIVGFLPWASKPRLERGRQEEVRVPGLSEGWGQKEGAGVDSAPLVFGRQGGARTITP